MTSDADALNQRAVEVARGYGLQLIRRLGHGGMGEVYLAKRLGAAGFEKQVVVKRLAASLSGQDEFTETLVKEAKIMVRFNHPNIVQVNDLVFDKDEYLMVLEHVDGPSLRRVVAFASRNDMVVPLEAALSIAFHVAKALSYAHTLVDDEGRPSPVVHCDVTPENVLLSRLGDVKLTDFGIARVMHTTSLTGSGQIRGKFRYVAPEQLDGTNRIGPLTDVYTLGLVLYEMLTLEAARKGEDTVSLVSEALRSQPLEIPSTISERKLEVGRVPQINAVLRRASAAKIEDRYQSADELAAALQGVADELGLPLDTNRSVGPFVRALLERPDFVAAQTPRRAGDSSQTPTVTERRVAELARRAPTPTPATPIVATPPPLPAAPVVLVVDDSDLVRELLSRALPRFGFSIATVGSGGEALDWLAANKCDAVLCDLNMPDLSGLELCSFIRRNPAWVSIPIILLTSETDSSRAVTGLGLGADDYVRKGVTEAEIAARIHAVLRRAVRA